MATVQLCFWTSLRSVMAPIVAGRNLAPMTIDGPDDLVAIVRVREHEQLADVVTRHIAALDGIVHTTTMFAFQAYSRHDLESMWGLGIE